MAAQLEAAEREENQISNPQSPCCTPSPLPSSLGAQALSKQQEEPERRSFLAQEESGTLAGDHEHSKSDKEEDAELPQGEMNKYQEMSQGEACSEPEL